MTPYQRIPPPLKWHGGKYYLAPRIIALMPKHLHYVEPFAGGLSVLLAKDPEGVSEVVNDLDGSLTTFWLVLQNEGLFEKFQRRAEATPFSEIQWEAMRNLLADPQLFGAVDPDGLVTLAWAFFGYCRQSLAGRMGTFAPLSRTRTRRGMNEQASAWIAAVDGLPEVHARLRRVVILNHDALDVIQQQDGPDTLFYLDPPYLAGTRAADNVYTHEMSWEQHVKLLEIIRQCKGRVMLSGYESDLYDRQLGDWNRHDFTIPNQAAGGEKKRLMTEMLWCNF